MGVKPIMEMKPFTVFGFYKEIGTSSPPDYYDRWIDYVLAPNVRMAASISSWTKQRNNSTLYITEVIEGHYKGRHMEDDCIVSQEQAQHNLTDIKHLLPTYLGLSPSLDQAIERVLKGP